MGSLLTVAKALGSETRLQLLRILAEGPKSAVETTEAYNSTFNTDHRRSTIYRELENLVDSGLVEKSYKGDNKKLEYHTDLNRVLLEFDDDQVIFEIEEEA